MKFIVSAFFVTFILTVTNTVSAQNSTQSKEVSSMKTANSERVVQEYHFQVDSAKLATKNKHTPANYQYIKDVEYYDNFIAALETKRSIVINDPAKKAEAEESGWFDQIDSEIAKAKAEREKLLQK